eukprot:PhF_6_TR6903/c0_g1_i1/m.10024
MTSLHRKESRSRLPSSSNTSLVIGDTWRSRHHNHPPVTGGTQSLKSKHLAITSPTTTSSSSSSHAPWRVHCLRSCCESPGVCFCSCLFPCCIAASQRSRALALGYNKSLKNYKCFPLFYPTVCPCCSCCQVCNPIADKPMEGECCGGLLLATEVLFCLPCSVRGTRFILQQRYNLQDEGWEMCMHECPYCCYFVMDCCTTPCIPCILAQQSFEMKYQKKHPTAPPSVPSMLGHRRESHIDFNGHLHNTNNTNNLTKSNNHSRSNTPTSRYLRAHPYPPETFHETGSFHSAASENGDVATAPAIDTLNNIDAQMVEEVEVKPKPIPLVPFEEAPFPVDVHLTTRAETPITKGQIAEFRTMIQREHPTEYGALHTWLTDVELHRFLIARNYDLKKSTALIFEAMKFRLSKGYKIIEMMDGWKSVLSHESETGKIYSPGHDIYGRPVVVLDNTVENTKSVDDQMKLLAWNLDFAVRQMPPHIDKFVVFVHLTNFSFLNTPPMSATKQTLNMLSNCFPERMGHCIAFQPPAVFKVFLGTIRPLIDAKTFGKVIFIRGDVEDGSENDEKLKTIIGPHWKTLTGACQPVYVEGNSPGFDHDEYWPTIDRRLKEEEDREKDGEPFQVLRLDARE